MPRSIVIAVLTLTATQLLPIVRGQDSDTNRIAAERATAILDEFAAWRPLFNERDLTGWKGDTEGYVVRDGVLVCQKGAKNLQTVDAFGDFAFQFEFKLQESGNNGIGIRVPDGGHPAGSGMEIQILDHHGSRYQMSATRANGRQETISWLKPWQYHGSIYGVVPARTGYLKPVGEWNTETIVAIDDHVMVILNGAVIVDAFLDDTTPADGKSHPGTKQRAGHIVLAGHSDHVEFRELRVADFSPAAPEIAPTIDNSPPEGFQALFNGEDLSGWKGLAHRNANSRRAMDPETLKTAQQSADERMKEHWSVADGILTYDGQGDSLCTAKDYGDFELYCDWKIPPGADSGIYLRGTPQVQIWDPWDPRTKDGDLPESPQAWVSQYSNGRNLGSGGLWNNKQWRNSPTVLADRPPGEWNQFLIRMVGERVSIWLNGKQIVDRVKLENYWDKTRQTPIPRADQIELQHHGSKLYFRNLFIRELPY